MRLQALAKFNALLDSAEPAITHESKWDEVSWGFAGSVAGQLLVVALLPTMWWLTFVPVVGLCLCLCGTRAGR